MMALKLTFLGHAGFLLNDGTHALAIDPFLTNNPVATMKPEEIECQFIAVTHGHPDHVGDTATIAKANNATVFACFEVCQYLGEQDVQCSPGNPGGRITGDFGWVAFTQAFHSSSFEGRYMGTACGVVVSMGGVTLYHCGDTGLFGDMKLIGEVYKPDIACIPVGDRFVMGPELGTRAAELIKPKVAIPMHYGTWEVLAPDAAGFKPSRVEVKLLEPGESWSYG
jgi:L-ascorbate metabolism protein UlaG (beta-lactamase superfamily)